MIEAMEAIVLIALDLLVVAILFRRIASAPLFTMLSISFANWADESRARH